MKKFRLVFFFAAALLFTSIQSSAKMLSNNIVEQHYQLSVSKNSSYHPIKRHKHRKHRHGLKHKRAIVVIRRRFR